ncbi:unnamed protein product, partial [Didymodactylos carnosus]
HWLLDDISNHDEPNVRPNVSNAEVPFGAGGFVWQ